MPKTYEKIATTTLTSASNTITFTSIPSTYTDLRLVSVPIFSGSGEVGFVRFNSDATLNYSTRSLVGTGTTAFTNTSGGLENQISFTEDQALGSIAGSPQLAIFDIFSYSGTTYKTILGQCANDQNGSGGSMYRVCNWRSTSTINRIDILTLSAANFSIGTTVTLYGILKA
jgi:hypothetical protein